MFTGIIKIIGTIRHARSTDGDLRLAVSAPGFAWRSQTIGDSIAVNGVCLTAVALDDDGFEADVSGETLAVSALASVEAGSRVNLEPALCAGEPLGGHLVSGHVDCTGTVTAYRKDARSTFMRIGIATEYARYVAKKGSVCVDGVSLTINEVSNDSFDVNIIPHTAAVTIAGDYRVGTSVNIEVDMLARYLERLLRQQDSGVSKEFLRAHGYA